MAQTAVWGVSQGALSASATSAPWPHTEFVGAFSDLYTNACWPNKRVWEARPFATTTLRQAFKDEILTASPEDQEVLIADYTDITDRGQFIAQGWPHMEGADNLEARTAVGEVIDIANAIRTAWARKFEQLD